MLTGNECRAVSLKKGRNSKVTIQEFFEFKSGNSLKINERIN
jgi:hypothetical protein